MASCTYCGKPAGIGRDFHVDCRETALAAPPPTAEQIETARVLALLQPMIQKSVYRASIGAAFTMLGVYLVLGILYEVLR